MECPVVANIRPPIQYKNSAKYLLCQQFYTHLDIGPRSVYRLAVDKAHRVEIIKREMERRMLRPVELARMAGISRQRVYQTFHGESTSLSTIRLMWLALGMMLEKPNAKG